MESAVYKLVTGIVFVIIGFVIVFYIIGNMAGTITTASGNISNSGLPLASLFSNSGVVLIIFMIAVFMALIILAFKLFKGGGK